MRILIRKIRTVQTTSAGQPQNGDRSRQGQPMLNRYGTKKRFGYQ